MGSRLQGLGVSAGEAAGPVARLAPPPQLPPATEIASSEIKSELTRVRDALDAVGTELDKRAAATQAAAREVLVAQGLIARDPVLLDGACARVRSGSDAAHAIDAAFAEHRRALEAIGGYLGERAADLQDLSDRAVAWLLGLPMPGVPEPGHPFVLVAMDLAPADTALLDPATVLAIITEQGGPTSHTAILAKQLGIPAVTACAAASQLRDGEQVLVDGNSGEVLTDPSAKEVAEAGAKSARRAARRTASKGPGRTADGHPIPLLANIGGPADLDAAARYDAEGVGLLRTEFMFLERATAPTLAEQRDELQQVFEAFTSRRVVVRTLDVGADKPLPYVPQNDEPNPALGVRGLRMSRTNPELLDQQLQAIAQAAKAAEADVWVMAPMVATAAEAREFASAAHAHGLGRIGVMIEVPAAAICARDILPTVDFASIGTNDLAQYTLAADRLAGELADLLDPWQPALLRLIATTASAGTELDRAVGVCGEAASDPLLALVLVGLGITSLSMAPACLPDVRAALAEHTIQQCRTLAAAALHATSPQAARASVTELAQQQVAATAATRPTASNQAQDGELAGASTATAAPRPATPEPDPASTLAKPSATRNHKLERKP
ncbi:MAG: phosphoenolpyruvate--protein phosphotransferase [Solirubrobacteraceae bacterium]